MASSALQQVLEDACPHSTAGLLADGVPPSMTLNPDRNERSKIPSRTLNRMAIVVQPLYARVPNTNALDLPLHYSDT